MHSFVDLNFLVKGMIMIIRVIHIFNLKNVFFYGFAKLGFAQFSFSRPKCNPWDDTQISRQHSSLFILNMFWHFALALVIGNFRFRYRFRPKFRFRYEFRFRFRFGSSFRFRPKFRFKMQPKTEIWWLIFYFNLGTFLQEKLLRKC
jgi:hypothetical protein